MTIVICHTLWRKKMGKHVPRVATILWCLFLSQGVLNASLTEIASSAQRYDVGDRVDNFTLPAATGDSISLYDFLGTVILIHVWHAG
jgi:cytochrome oxidase Cu insertion factor (SCO1/SenC/PrrC family)